MKERKSMSSTENSADMNHKAIYRNQNSEFNRLRNEVAKDLPETVPMRVKNRKIEIYTKI